MKIKKGIILIEVLVSLAILTLGILFLINSLTLIVQSNQHLRHLALSVLIADNMFNRLKSGESIEKYTDFDMLGTSFRYKQEESSLSDRLKMISLSVAWQKAKEKGNVAFTNILTNENKGI